MDKVTLFLETHFMPIAFRIGEQRHLRAIRDGVIAALPLLLIGSVFLMAGNPPIASLEEAVRPYVNNLNIVVNATFGIMGLIAAFATAYSLADAYKIDKLSAAVISTSAFLVSTPFTSTGDIAASWMGSQGLFHAMIIALVTVEIQRFFIVKNLVISMPDGVPPSVARSFAALIPGFVIITMIWSLGLFSQSIAQLSIPEITQALIQKPLLGLGSSLTATVIAVFLVHLLWSFGLHGAAIVGTVTAPVWLTLTEQNAAAVTAGNIPPNIICQQFVDTFIYLGGSGSTLALVVMMMFAAKSKQVKLMGKTSFWPGLFNINEPLVFGMPIVMNPVILIPFITAPVVLTIISYFALSNGFAAKLFVLAPWTSPILLSGFITSGGKLNVLVLQIINFSVAGLIYYPFFRIWDKQKLKEEQGVDVIVVTASQEIVDKTVLTS